MAVLVAVESEAARLVARRQVEQVMHIRGWNVSDLQRETGADLGTIGDFLNGKRWPQRSTQTKIEDALGLTPGSIAAWARGEDPQSVVGREQDGEVLLSVPADALDGLTPSEREEALSVAKATMLERIREIRRRLGS